MASQYELYLTVHNEFTNPVLLSTLVRDLGEKHPTCITIKVPNECVLMLDAHSSFPTVTHLFIEGPMPPPVHHADHSINNIHAVVTGPILAIIQNYPRLRVLDFRALNYDVDWSGLESAQHLERLKLWSYENIERPMMLPPNCSLDLFGLITWYRRDPHRTIEYILHALCKCRKPVEWSIGYHDPAHVSLLQSIESQHTLINGTTQEHLHTP
jgi:hypothetical protein